MKVNVQRGLKVRKSTGSQLGDWTILVEWAANLANQISYPHGVEMLNWVIRILLEWNRMASVVASGFFWNGLVMVKVSDVANQLIHGIVRSIDRESWSWFTAVYASS
ncbi:hypothetical protein V6N12_041862 [Hibiscus sabdariffa]|uniref:Uncharacterized protein n=1 Tax=Hibiscus sabdariffa TaxID=183260 RepID=A0ABR2ED36_9ROSI